MAEFDDEDLDEIITAVKLITKDLDESMRADDELNINAVLGNNDLAFETVKAGRELNIEIISGYNNTSACTRIRVGYWNGHRFNWLVTEPAPLVTETVAIVSPLRLRAGMYPVVRFEDCAADDDIYASLNGYWKKI